MIGLDFTAADSPHAIRGIGRYVQSLVDALATECPEWSERHVRVLTTASVPAPLPHPWTTQRSTFRPQDIGWLVAAFADRAAVRGRPPDIWHQTDPTLPIGPLPASRSIVTAYDLIPLHVPEVMARVRRHRRIVYDLYLRRLRRALVVLAISQTTASDVAVTLGIPSERIHVIYPPVAPRLSSSTGSAGSSTGPVDFLFVGVPEAHKRPELAITALYRSRRLGLDGRLTFAGHHPPRDRGRLVSLADSLGLMPNVRFLDRISDAALARLFSQGILLALSSHEGFGLPPVECLFEGGRVVAVRTPIYEEVLGEAAHYAADDSAEAIAAAMVTASEAAPPPAGILADLRTRYSPARTAQRLVALYQEAVGSVAGRPL